MKKSFKADLALVFVAFVWGSGFVASKWALEAYAPLYIMAFRFSLAFALMAAVFHRKLKGMDPRAIKGGMIIGLFLYLAFAAQTVGLQYTTASKNAFLTAVYVVMVPYLYWIVSRDRPDRYHLIAAFVTLAGIGLLSLRGEVSFNVGDALTLLCALGFAAHMVAISIFAREEDTVVLTILQFGVAALLSWVTAPFFDPFPTAHTWLSFGSMMYLAVFSTLFCFLVQTTAQKYTSATHTAIILSLESVFGTGLSILLLSEPMTLKMAFGFLLIFLGILTAETKWNFLRKNNGLVKEDLAGD